MYFNPNITDKLKDRMECFTTFMSPEVVLRGTASAFSHILPSAPTALEEKERKAGRIFVSWADPQTYLKACDSIITACPKRYTIPDFIQI